MNHRLVLLCLAMLILKKVRDHLSAGLVVFNYFNDNFPSNPLCNPSRFKGDLWKPLVGYTCPAGYLSYLACIIASNIYWSVSNSNWVVNYTTANYAFEASAARNITCSPAMEP
ncbi:hypothetical protein PRIPAC_82717, partial [Pristionchus pacificus]|uniref:Uncharacterized protein n=1 Tax=Pristionchus pacificus TaxID=54126 RepID=A0A2A6C2V1_PRIPA